MAHAFVSIVRHLVVAALVAGGAVALSTLGIDATRTNPTRTVMADNVKLAKNGDTHITGYGVVTTIDCNDSTILVNGAQNVVTTLGSCYAVTVQGSGNTVIAENVVNDITVYGFNQKVLFKTGDPAIIDRGRELGMTNFINRVPG
jgi:hypothetical protein